MHSRLFGALRRFSHPKSKSKFSHRSVGPPRIGLALGGGFARGIAHAGVLEILDRHRIPIHCITGVSAGSIVAAAYASGATPAEIARAGCSMRFGDIARWSLCRMGFVVSERMQRFLEKLLKVYRFEQMRIPLGVLATDLSTGEPRQFQGYGDVFLPIRASCSYPGLFSPVRLEDRLLVDGAMSAEVPVLLARQLGATHVISVHLPAQSADVQPSNMFQVVNRCFQILQTRTEDSWREQSDLVITPDVRKMQWDAFSSGPAMIESGRQAAQTAIPVIQSWLERWQRVWKQEAPPDPRSSMPDSEPA
jgi:NTE family protein